MNQYVMLGRFNQQQPGRIQPRINRPALAQRILERTMHMPGTRINQVRLTLGRFDAVISIEAESNDAAYDLATEIAEAAHMTVETLAVASGQLEQHPPPAPVREPIPTRPDPDQEPTRAEQTQSHT